jgi:hypothetical protein
MLSLGKTRMAMGRVKIISEITHESETLSYAILYMGEHNLTGSVRKFDSPEAHDAMVKELKAAYETSDFPETIRVMDRHFGATTYSLKSLFKDEQRRILSEILASAREDLETRFRLITERYEPLAKFLHAAGVPYPGALESVFDLVLHEDIRREIAAEPLNIDKLRSLIEHSRSLNGRVLDADISYAIKTRMERMMQQLREMPEELPIMQALQQFAEAVMHLPLGLNLWKVQNLYWEMLQQIVPQYRERAQNGDGKAADWLNQFATVGEKLSFNVQNVRVQNPAVQMAA